jgi:hypothetical protein
VKPDIFLKTVASAKDVTSHYDFIDERAKTNPDELIPIFEWLSEKENLVDRSWQLRSVFERILEAVCLNKGERQISTALQLYKRLDDLEKYKRRIAAYLASAQKIEDLLSITLRYVSTLEEYLISLLSHELVCRGYDLRHYSDFFSIADVVNARSTFNGLTLYPHAFEMNLPLRRFGAGTSGNPIDFGLYDLPFEKFSNASRTINDFREVDTITLAVGNWADESGGLNVGIKGNFPPDLSPQDLLGTLNYADFYASEYKLQSESCENALKYVFGACANGGAYNYGEYPAVARLYTWQSLNSMVNDNRFVNIEITESKLKDYDFYQFCLNKWFINEWLDLVHTSNFAQLKKVCDTCVNRY